jgi:hypothetical protein
MVRRSLDVLGGMMYIQKVYRDLQCTEAAIRAIAEARADGYRVVSFWAAPQPTLFDGKDDAYVELRVVKEKSDASKE